MNKKKYPIVLQHDQTDCGVACLLSVIHYYGGSNSLENLRRMSGTNVTGTTLLGLFQTANDLGFTAQGCEADLAALIDHGKPCVLHVTMDNHLPHYVVFYGDCPSFKKKSTEAGRYLVGDPAKGLVEYSAEELTQIWKSKTCLTLEPNADFVKDTEKQKAKKKWILDLLRADFSLLSVAVGLGIVMATLGLAMAIFSQRLIDDILPHKNYEKLFLGIGLVFVLLFVKEGLSVLRQYFLLRQAKGFNIRIIRFFFGHLLQLPRSFFDTRKTGEFTARLNDTTRIQRVISQLAGSMAIDILIVLVSIVFIFIYAPMAGFICLVALPLFFLMVFWHNKKIIEGQRNIMIQYALSEGNYISTLQGIEPVKNSNKQSLFENINNVIYQKYQEAVYHLGTIQIKLSFLINGFCVFFLIGILSYCSYQVLNNQLKTGELIAVISMCGSLLPSVVNLALIMIPVNEAKIAFDRMFEFTGALAEPMDGELLPSEFSGLSVSHLSFRFPGRKQLLQDVFFKVQRGEIIAFMGENGSGKSTLSQILQKNYPFESGEILINDRHPLHQLNTTQWRGMVAAVPQQVHIFNGTVLDNIGFNEASENPDKLMAFLESFGFLPFLNALPQSVLTLVGEEGINLSGGQKQMIGLARALYQNPQLLILDEVTSAMDREAEQFVLQLVKRLKSQMAIIFITHRLHVLRLICDRIYILDKGTIASFGTHQHLLQHKNLYSDYWKDLEYA